MKQAKKEYRKYTVLEKYKHIKGTEKSTAPKSTAHSWMNGGREAIEQLAEKDGLKEIAFFNKQLQNSCKDAVLHTLDFFLNIVCENQSLEKQFKKQRTEFVNMIEKIKPLVAMDELLATVGYSRQSYSTLKNKINCRRSPGNTCLNSALNQFDNDFVVDLQRRYFNIPEYKDFSLSDLFARLKNDRILFVSFPKFCEIAIALGEDEKRKREYKKEKPVGRRAHQVNELIHADKTMYKLNGKKVWIYLICDNYSRRILAAHVSYSSKSKESLHTLKKAIADNNLEDVYFDYLTDDGSENKGLVKEFIATQPNIKHLIAQTDKAPYSNSMIESVIKYFKNDILLRKSFVTLEDLITAVEEGVTTYNNRNRRFLNCGTPNDFYFGNEPNEDEYKVLYKESAKLRIQKNKEYNCLKPCIPHILKDVPMLG
ncbi:MAG: DDE-type integrase/transposase/recombinase [Bacteroidota bacterium]|nr:DDE-type integrase/transposase/recombinase [Bacteroidota bacterium]